MRWSTGIRRRGVMLLATLVLVLALALSACGGHAQRLGTNGGTTQQTAPGTSGQANSAAQDVISADTQIQGMLSGMDDMQNAANTDYTSQETEIQP